MQNICNARVETAIILVGGKGTRLSGFLPDIPKPLAPISGRPLLEFIVEDLGKAGVRKAILATGYMADAFNSYNNAQICGVHIICRGETEPLGSAGAILNCQEDVVSEKRFFVINGDTIINADIEGIFRPFKQEIARVGLMNIVDASRYGRVQIDKDKNITMFQEKLVGTRGLVSVGIVLLKKEIISVIHEKRNQLQRNFISLETDIFPDLALKKQITSEVFVGDFVDIGIPSSYAQFNYDMTLGQLSEELNGEIKCALLKAIFSKRDIIYYTHNPRSLLVDFLQCNAGNVIVTSSPIKEDGVLWVFHDNDVRVQTKAKVLFLIKNGLANNVDFISSLCKGWEHLRKSVGGISVPFG